MKSDSKRKHLIHQFFQIVTWFSNLELYRKADDEINKDEVPDNVQDVISMGQQVLHKIYIQREIMADIDKQLAE